MCGIFGIYAKPDTSGNIQDVANISYEALLALQHRGKESCGITTSDSSKIKGHWGPGEVKQVFSANDIEALSIRGKSRIAVGHVRYSTSKSSALQHVQPILMEKQFALAHNGNLPSVAALKQYLRNLGVDVGGNSDSRLMAQDIFYHTSGGMEICGAIRNFCNSFSGAFSVIILSKDALYAFRDPWGMRPLVVGMLKDDYVIASESCAFEPIGAKLIREIEPGELIKIDEDGLHHQEIAKPLYKFDLFEPVYFAHPASLILGQRVQIIRNRSGEALADQYPLDVDLVIPTPLTGIPAAESYAQKLRIPLGSALVKHHNAGRTFIEPEQQDRALAVRRKFTVIPELVKDKRVALVDDSIVRGTTSRELVAMLRGAGAKEVHLLISSPPVLYPDFYGIDTREQSELIAWGKTNGEICELIGAESINYLSLDKLIEATGIPADQLSTSCFTGDYPIPLFERAREVQFLGAAAK